LKGVSLVYGAVFLLGSQLLRSTFFTATLKASLWNSKIEFS